MGKEKGTDNKNNKSLTLHPRICHFCCLWHCGGPGGQGEGDRQKKNKSLTLKGFVVFVVFGLPGAQVGKEKGTDNKSSKFPRVNKG